jgi:hypothetical protein
VKRVALVLVALLLAGCAGMGGTKKPPPPKTLSHAQFVRAADRACVRFGRQTKGLKKPTSFETFDRTMRVATRAYEQTLFTLRGLAPPATDATAFQRLLSGLDAQDKLIHSLTYAVDAHQLGRTKVLVRRLRVIGKRDKSNARRLGLRAPCN